MSVVVASRGRPRDLTRCLTALGQIRYRPVEIVVVSDPDGLRAAAAHPLGQAIRATVFDVPNIAEARNIGTDFSSGEIVAFLDDDAVPEPLWLDHLVGAFSDPEVAAASGYVIARNGIGLQWAGRSISPSAETGSLGLSGDEPVAFRRLPEGAVMLEGTNMALRRSILEDVGGFDSAFRFYLDDADMALRVAVAVRKTAVVPLARVHHAFSASPRRRRDRMPLDLFDVGRSLAVFLRKHAADGVAPGLARGRAAERRRLLACMVAGRCEPGDVAGVLRSFDEGVEAGKVAEFGTFRKISPAPERFADIGIRAPGAAVIAGRTLRRQALADAARRKLAAGSVPTVFRFSRTALYHRVRYVEGGYWLQTGGIFGRSERSEVVFRTTTLADRVGAEIERVAKVRGIPDTDIDWV